MPHHISSSISLPSLSIPHPTHTTSHPSAMTTATTITTLFMALLLISRVAAAAAAAANDNINNPDMALALAEMKRANYFTFVMLINMAPPDLTLANITFLMPNDKSLATITDIAETSVTDFLLRHSIPWPLLFDHMEYFPTGSLIPTSRPGFVLKVSNDGRRRFFFNNARIVSPNICTTGSSIRCHGIDGVLQPASLPQDGCPSHPLPPPPHPPHPPAVINATHPKPLLPSPPSSGRGDSPHPPPPPPSPSPPPSSVEVDDDSPRKSGSDNHRRHRPLVRNGGVVSLVMMLCFML